MGGKDYGYHGFWPDISIQKAQTDQSPKKVQVSLHEDGSRPEVQIVGYPIT